MSRITSVARRVSLLLILLMIQHQLFAQQSKKYWVYFVDKGSGTTSHGKLIKTSQAYRSVESILSPRAIQRRAKVLPQESIMSTEDVPLHKTYLDKVMETGAILAQQSRWMNAASFVMNPQQVVSVASLPFVTRVAPVIIFKRKKIERNELKQPESIQDMPSSDYGQSLEQLTMIDVPPLHDMGITGEGVLVGMLDAGFRWKKHEALQTRNVVAEYDFIFHDSVTANESNDASNQDAHGTLTLSVLGGYKEGKLVGPAYGAAFALAKTEYIPSETTYEEDDWAAGIEWLESLGVDVVSSSLGYNEFQDDSGYTWENGDFDGRTSVTALAALHAARLGVLVCTSMGNEGNGNGIKGTMLTPGDADSVISVGAVNFSKALAYYSSTGPTNDGRIKPDIVAPGTSVLGASTSGFSSYVREQGTSLSTPLVGGSAALILSARPELTPGQVIVAIKNTASTSNSSGFTVFPNNFLGWGIIDAFQAALSFGPIFSSVPRIFNHNGITTVSTDVVGKFGIKPDSVFFQYYDGDASGSSPVYQSLPMHFEQSKYFATSGTYSIDLSGLPPGFHAVFHIVAKDSAGNSYSSPAPVYEKDWELCVGTSLIRLEEPSPSEFILLQNYPNPFNSSTTITLHLSKCEWTSVRIYSGSGQNVRTLHDGYLLPGVVSYQWDGTTDLGNTAATGIYFVRVTMPSATSVAKMVLMR